MVGHWLHRTLSLAYETWHEHAHAQGRMRGILERMAARWRHREVAGGFVWWREQAERQKRAGYITGRIIRHWTHRTSAAAFEAWLVRSRDQRRMEEVCSRVVRRLSHRVLGAGFDAWLGFAFSSKHSSSSRHSMAGYSSGPRHGGSVPSRWLRARPLFEVLMARVVARVMAHGLLVWHEYAHTQRWQLTKLRRAVSRWTGVTACRCMSAWRESSVVKKELRRLASKVVMRVMYRGMWQAFDRMADHARERRALRCKAGKAMRLWVGSSLARCMYQWRGQVTDEQGAKARASKAVRHWLKRRAGYITGRIIRHWTHRTSAAAFEA